MSHNGTSVNTKLSKPSTSGTKIYSVTLFPKSKVILKVVEKNDLLKSVTSHLTINKIIEKCTKVLALGLVKIEIEPINAYFKNNRVVRHDYLKVTKEHVATLQELLEEARVLKPLDEHIGHASKFAEQIQELLVYVSASCPFTQSGNEKCALATSHRKNNKPYVDASRTKHTIRTITKEHAVKQNTRNTNNTMLPSTGRLSSTNANGSKLRGNTKNDRIPQPSNCNENVKNVALSKNSDTSCLSCNECLFSANHDACVVQYLKKMQKHKMAKSAKQKVKREWKPTGQIFKTVGLKWIPTAIMGYGDLQMGNILISRVYYVDGLGLNIFSVGQFYDSDLEVAFRKHTCFVRNLEGVDLLLGSRGSNLYTISMADMMKSSPICLLSKASKTKSWLWHRRLSHLNFGTINKLAKQGLVKGLPKLKYTKDHLCSACQMGKGKKESHPHKSEPSTNEKLQMLHMDLCGPMRVKSIDKKRYILIIVDDYSRFTWVKFLRTKDEALEIIVKFLKQAQVSLNATVTYLRTDNDTEFLNQTLQNYKEDVGITHMTSTACTPKQNGIVERRNRTLVEATRTMLIFSKSLLFLWAKAVATACYTQNRSLIHTCYDKTPYELLRNRKPELKYLHVFGTDRGKLQPKADIGIFIVITEYLVNISKRRAFWSLNEDILKITILTTNTQYPSRKIRHIRACTHQRPQRKEDQYVATVVYVSIEKPNKVLDTHIDYLNSGHGDSDNGSKKSASFASIFKENITKKTMQIS
ncbi:retrovirus-related pol polyprotein from transposon TNT 1-94 [Tanacetum coccineum]